MSETLSLDDRDAAFEAAVDTLSAGSVVVLPVDGVYAIVADAFRASATQRMFAARRRSRATPLPVLLRSPRQVAGLAGEVPDYADRLMAAYWPGPLTMILPASDGMTWDLGNGKGTVQLRQPQDDFLLQLIGRIGPLACTSANRMKQDRPMTAEAARMQLGVLIPVYIDGGELSGEVSTIVDATGEQAVVAREGAIPEWHVRKVAGGELPWGERPSEDDEPDPDADADAPPSPVDLSKSESPEEGDGEGVADSDDEVEATGSGDSSVE